MAFSTSPDLKANSSFRHSRLYHRASSHLKASSSVILLALSKLHLYSFQSFGLQALVQVISANRNIFPTHIKFLYNFRVHLNFHLYQDHLVFPSSSFHSTLLEFLLIELSQPVCLRRFVDVLVPATRLPWRVRNQVLRGLCPLNKGLKLREALTQIAALNCPHTNSLAVAHQIPLLRTDG